MRIKDFCRLLGIHRSTVLRLESKGLLQSKRDWAGHRRFTEDDLQRALKLIYQEPDAITKEDER